jgi:hypothetical protein
VLVAALVNMEHRIGLSKQKERNEGKEERNRKANKAGRKER